MALKDDIRADKRRLRRKIEPIAGVAAAKAAARQLVLARPPQLRRPLFRRPRFLQPVFASYSAVGHEMTPGFVEAELWDRGWRRALPAAPNRDDPLVFREARAPETFVPDAFNVVAPPPTARALEPEVLFVPLVAFDRRGGRIGQGGGTYDRTLADLRARRNVWVIGLAYACQEAPDIPMEAHDQRLDAILTEVEYIAVARET